MKYQEIIIAGLPVDVKRSSFTGGGVGETHVVINYQDCTADAATQFEDINTAINHLNNNELKGLNVVWQRFFVSDAANQSAFINNQGLCFSLVQQPPLNGTKLSVWLYYVAEGNVEQNGNITSLTHSGYIHYYHTQLHIDNGENVDSQTETVFKNYCESLQTLDCNLADNCIRTWIYVKDVDNNYKGMLTVRREYFINEGLTKSTHYIASTGIEGSYTKPAVLFLMDAYAVKGIEPKQIKYLYAPEHLSPTHIYGVTFERGTAVDYGDRRHIYISGTASIDNKGEIVHKGDVVRQADRTFENIRALLAEANAGMADIAQMIVYLRDTADYKNVHEYMENRYPTIPKVIVLAPVCRPGWLIEVECIAITQIKTEYSNY